MRLPKDFFRSGNHDLNSVTFYGNDSYTKNTSKIIADKNIRFNEYHFSDIKKSSDSVAIKIGNNENSLFDSVAIKIGNDPITQNNSKDLISSTSSRKQESNENSLLDSYVFVDTDSKKPLEESVIVKVNQDFLNKGKLISKNTVETNHFRSPIVENVVQRIDENNIVKAGVKYGYNWLRGKALLPLVMSVVTGFTNLPILLGATYILLSNNFKNKDDYSIRKDIFKKALGITMLGFASIAVSSILPGYMLSSMLAGGLASFSVLPVLTKAIKKVNKHYGDKIPYLKDFRQKINNIASSTNSKISPILAVIGLFKDVSKIKDSLVNTGDKLIHSVISIINDIAATPALILGDNGCNLSYNLTKKAFNSAKALFCKPKVNQPLQPIPHYYTNNVSGSSRTNSKQNSI